MHVTVHVTAEARTMPETKSRKVGETIDEKSTRQLGAPVIEVAALCCCGRRLHRSTKYGISRSMEVCECQVSLGLVSVIPCAGRAGAEVDPDAAGQGGQGAREFLGQL